MLQELVRRGRSLFPSSRRQFDFAAAANRFAARLRNEWACTPEPARQHSDNIGVVVSPWLFTPAPFFMMELALQLRVAGHPVTVIWDASDTFIDTFKPREVAAVRPLLDLLPAWLPFVDMQAIRAEGTRPFGFVDKMLYENSVRHLKGEADVDSFISANPQWKSAMQLHANRVASLVGWGKMNRFCIPGGVWANSGIWSAICGELNVPYTTLDSGPGQVFVSQNSAAAHFGDVRATLEAIAESEEDLQPLVALARQALQTRMDGRDPFALQQSSRTNSSEQYDVVVPLNLRFDSAALCRQRVFASVTEWLDALLEHISTKSGTTVAIRQHPCERLDAFRGNDAWNEILGRFLRPGGPIRFFPAEAQINTYDLIESAKVVLPFTSRVGIEAAMMGKPVVTSADCYYDKCGFTLAAADAGGYFRSIDEALGGAHLPGARARERAAVAYYIMEYCTALPSRFTPQPNDFDAWIKVPAAELVLCREMKFMLDAAAGRATLASSIHAFRFSNQSGDNLSSCEPQSRGQVNTLLQPLKD